MMRPNVKPARVLAGMRVAEAGVLGGDPDGVSRPCLTVKCSENGASGVSWQRDDRDLGSIDTESNAQVDR
jgi:hypothetical protein